MPNRCVVIGCSNIPDLEKGIALHAIPYWDDNRPIPQERRRKWIEFVQVERANWEASRWSVICSKHFTADDFQRRYSSLEGFEKFWIPRLKRDDFGVNVYPSVHDNIKVKPKDIPCTSSCNASRHGSRRRRKELKETFLDNKQSYDQLKSTVISLRTRLRQREKGTKALKTAK
ncbi:THAP domain-containing protein 1-like isoform X2 [Actinia tenebrosa]|nr:THAP domain-containing protein 1-like isoform X2 [Actinia tenebrosa]